MYYFEALDGSFYPTLQIERIGAGREVIFKPADRKGVVHTVHLSGDRTCEIPAYEFQRIQNLPSVAYAAIPGTSLIQADPDGGKHFASPVIGWAVSGEGVVLPITVDGVNDGMPDAHYIQLHDGSVHRADDGSWDTMENWKASMAKVAK